METNTKTMLSIAMISFIIIQCVAECPGGVGVFSGFLVPFGVCRGTNGMYSCNEEGTAVMWDNCIEGMANPDPIDSTMMFSTFTCEPIADCNYFLFHEFEMDTAEVETCESEEQVQFGDRDCVPTDCSMPDLSSQSAPSVETWSYMEYPNNPFFDYMYQPFAFLINECVPILSYPGGINGNWDYLLTGFYSYQRVYSCDPEFSGTGITSGIYADANCTILLEESQTTFQNSQVGPVLDGSNHNNSVCLRVESCSDESILTPTLAPTNSPTQAPVPTESPTNYPTESPTPPTFQPTSNPNSEPASIPTHRTSILNSNKTNGIKSTQFIMFWIVMASIYIS